MASVIELRDVGKRYLKLEDGRHLRRSFVRPRRGELWALRHLDLAVDEGETLGVLGHNGAGKTTLLRLLAGVTSPTEGHVRVAGRIGPLISLGVGFHPEMSGRENVLINGMLLGLSARQVAERFDEIVEFAELEAFIDTPVKFYSSGMTVRLGFAVIAHTHPTVLLIDEILAVGDAGFQFKCFERLRNLRADGATIVVVSHSMTMIRQLCERAILVRHGRLEYDGDTERAIALHCEAMSLMNDPTQPGSAVDIVGRRLLGGEGSEHHAHYDSPMTLELRTRFYRDVVQPIMKFAVRSDTGVTVARCCHRFGQNQRITHGTEMVLKVPFRARLGGGNYELIAEICDGDEPLGISEGLIVFVAGRAGSMGPVDLRAQIEVDGEDRTDRRASLLDA